MARSALTYNLKGLYYEVTTINITMIALWFVLFAQIASTFGLE